MNHLFNGFDFLTGTCAKCKSRFEFGIQKILDSGTSIACPKCGFGLSTKKLKEIAEAYGDKESTFFNE